MSFSLLALTFLAMQPVAQIENSANRERRVGAGDPTQIVCERQMSTGSRLDQRRICRTREEWAVLRGDTRNVINRVQIFPGGCESRDVCRAAALQMGPRGK